MKQVADNLLNKQHFDRVLSGNFSHLEVETLEENIIMEEKVHGKIDSAEEGST